MAGTNNLSSARTNIKIDNSTVLIPHGEAEYKVDKLFFSAVKEEEWLNLLASRGYALVGRKFTGYIFAVDKVAAKYYYSVCLLPAPAEAEYSEHYMAEKSGHKTHPVCTFSNKAYYRTAVEESGEGVVIDATAKSKHLKRAFAFNFGLLLFWLGLLCYNITYWVRFDSAGVAADKSSFIWKLAIDMSDLLGSYPTTPYIVVCAFLVALCIPFTVYYFDQYMYSRSFLAKVNKAWRKK